MKTLLNNIKTFLESAVTSGAIHTKPGGGTITVVLGINRDPSQIPFTEFPYIALDDGGERTEDLQSDTQHRIYSPLVEIGYAEASVTGALEGMLDLTNEIKTVFELKANRQKDGFRWGLEISPYTWDNEGLFYRARIIRMEYWSIEDKYTDH